MSIIKILLFGNRKGKPAKTSRKPTSETPIKSHRGKIWFEGNQYEVKLHHAARNSVKINENTLDIYLSGMTRENFAALIDGWYRRKARAKFKKAVEKWLPYLEERGYRVDEPRLKQFRMRRAWGRCYYTKGLITLNLHLVKAPQECFDYIVLHELCHFVVHNHSKAFFALQSDILPGWEEIDTWLKNFARKNRIIS